MELSGKTADKQNENRAEIEQQFTAAAQLKVESQGVSLYLRHPNQMKLLSYEHDERGLGINAAGWERTEQCRQSEAVILPSAVCCCWMSSLRFRQNPAFNEGTWPTHFPE